MRNRGTTTISELSEPAAVNPQEERALRGWMVFIVCGAVLAQAHAQTIEIPGAGPPAQLLRVLANEFNARHAPVRVNVPPSSGQSGALDAIKSGHAALARMPRRLTADEERQGIAHRAIAREAIVFATGADVTVSGVTREQLAGIFAGRLTNWRELGGTSAPIRVHYREETAETLRTIRSRLPEFATLKFTQNGRTLNLDFEVIEALERFGWGVGWGSAGNVRAAKGLRVLALDGVVPSAATLRSGQYPLYFELVLIHRRGPLPELAKQFLDFVASAGARKLIEAFGAIPLEMQ